MKRLLALVLLATVAAACGGGSTGSSAATPGPSATAAAATVLPTGKELLALETRVYRSPDGFLPAITVDVPAGWSSSHRFDDAFDITQPDPTRDAPAVALIFMTPAAPTAAEAVAAIRTAAGAAARPRAGQIGSVSAIGVDITDGSGTVVESVRRGIGLDAQKGQRLRVLAADLGGKPLLAVVLVPVAANWDTLVANAQALLDTVRAT